MTWTGIKVLDETLLPEGIKQEKVVNSDQQNQPEQTLDSYKQRGVEKIKLIDSDRVFS